MALIKEIELENGVPVRYHRVVSVNTVTNVQAVVEVASYVSQAKREAEKSALAAGEPMDVFIRTRYLCAPYGACPTAAAAYRWLKESEPEFQGAEDVFDDSDPMEVTGEEFIAMLEEVM